jgi:hypothetical protein
MSFEEILKLCDQKPIHEGHPHAETLRDIYLKGYLPWFESYRAGEVSLEKNLAGMRRNGLTEEEAFFILAYSSSCSRWLNSDLRNGYKLSGCKAAFADGLDAALTKVRSYKGIVFRMELPLGDEAEVLQWFRNRIGKKFSAPFFLSTAQEDYENSPMVWKINTLSMGSNGKDISDICQAPLELEVLFQRHAKFQIMGVEQKTQYVILNELDANEQVDFPLVGIYHKNY